MFSNISIKLLKLHRSIPASGSSNNVSFVCLTATVAISILFSSPPDNVPFTSLSTYSFAHSPTCDNISHASFFVICFFDAILNKSYTVIPLNFTGCWNAKLIPKFALSSIGMFVMSFSWNMIFPESGFSIPIIIFASVDFPEPFGPVIAMNLFVSIFRFMLFSIFLPSLSKLIFCNSNILFLLNLIFVALLFFYIYFFKFLFSIFFILKFFKFLYFSFLFSIFYIFILYSFISKFYIFLYVLICLFLIYLFALKFIYLYLFEVCFLLLFLHNFCTFHLFRHNHSLSLLDLILCL